MTVPSSSAAECAEFASKVDHVSKLVQGLANGTIDVNDPVIQQSIKQSCDKSESVIEQQLENESVQQQPVNQLFRPGPGVADDYVAFCAKCRLEYLSIPPNNQSTSQSNKHCVQCNNQLIDRSERQSYLHARVSELKAAKAARAERRERFRNFQSNKQSNKQSMLSPSDWCDFEPSSDEDDDSITLMNPNFAALEQDLKARAAKRENDQAMSQSIKQQGNVAFQSGDYNQAIEFYNQSINQCKCNKSSYTNRALCYLRQGRYSDCLTDCSTVIDVWKYLDNGPVNLASGLAKKTDVELVVKAYLRRMEANLSINQFDTVESDLIEVEPLITQASNKAINRKQRTEVDMLKQRLIQAKKEVAKEFSIDQSNDETKDQLQIIDSFTLFLKQSIKQAKDQLDNPSNNQPINQSLLQSVLTISSTDRGRILFRIHSALPVIVDWLMCQTNNQTISQSTHQSLDDICTILQSLLLNEKNKQLFIDGEGLNIIYQLIINLSHEQSHNQSNSLLQVFAMMTENASARKKLIKFQDHLIDHLISQLNQLQLAQNNQSINQTTVWTCLANLAFDRDWKSKLSSKSVNIFSSVTKLLQSNNQSKNQSIDQSASLLSAIFSTLSNLSTIQSVRNQLIEVDDLIDCLIDCSIVLLQSNKQHSVSDIIPRMLAIWLNLTTAHKPSNQQTVNQSNNQTKLIDKLQLLLSPLLSHPTVNRSNSQLNKQSKLIRCRVYGLISRMSVNQQSINQLINQSNLIISIWMTLDSGVANQIHTKSRLINKSINQSDDDMEDDLLDVDVLCMENALKILVQCNSHDQSINQSIKQSNNQSAFIQTITSLLASSSHFLSGNAALLLSQLALDQVNVKNNLFNQSINPLIDLMIQCVNKEDLHSVAKNAAIALARLATNPEHLAVIRQRNGLSIMAQAAK